MRPTSRHKLAKAALLMLLFAFMPNAFGQKVQWEDADQGTSPTEKLKSPTTATWLSVAMPGAGQIYNGKWWKAPLVWGSIGAAIYLAIDNNREFNHFADAVQKRADTSQTDPYVGIYNDRALVEFANYHGQQRDFSIIIAVVLYGVQILDANVDAHLYHFEVTDDLSMNLRPKVNTNLMTMRWNVGLSLTFDF